MECIAFKGQDQIFTHTKNNGGDRLGEIITSIWENNIKRFFLKMSTVREWNRFAGKGQRNG